MKKTLLVTIDFPPQTGGVANYYFNLCTNLPPEKIIVLTTNSTGVGHGPILPNNQLKTIRKNLITRLPIWPRWLPMFWHIKKIVKQEKIELLWVGQILPVGTVIYYLSKKLKIPYIVSTHGTDLLSAQKKPRRFQMAQKILFHAKYITCNSQYTSTLLGKWNIDKTKTKVIYPGIESTKQHNNTTTQQQIIDKYNLQNKKIILSVARLVRRKGMDNIIKALPQVWQKIPNLIYIIIGNGPDRELIKQHINTSKNQNNILLLHNVNDQEKNAFYDLCDLFILPGRQEAGDIEGFGIVFLEAALHHKPSIASNIGGAKEAVLDGQTGLLVDPTNIDQIGETIIKLLEDDNLRSKLGENGYTRVIDQFQWLKQAELFSQLLD